jgi:hypothetical protein
MPITTYEDGGDATSREGDIGFLGFKMTKSSKYILKLKLLSFNRCSEKPLLNARLLEFFPVN